MKELKGTEKQIKWAEEIRKAMIERVEEQREAYKKFAARRNKDIDPTDNAVCDEMLAIIEKVENASTFINYRGALGNMAKDKFPKTLQRIVEKYQIEEYFYTEFND